MTYRIRGSHQAETISSDVVPVTASKGAEQVLLQALTGDVRFTLDGTDPVGGATGFVLFADQDPVIIDVGHGALLKFIRDATTDAELQIQFLYSADG